MDESGAFGERLSADELPGNEQLGTRISRRDSATWLAVGGELDAFTAPNLRQAIETAEEAEPATLVLDLRGVTFIDSSGLAVILGAHQRASEAGRPELKLVIAGAAAVESLFDTIGAREHLPLAEDPAALAAEHPG